MELVRAGTLNAWTDKSLAKLAELVPVRYAKDELSSGYLGSIERYAYVAPLAPQSASAEQPAVELPPTTPAEQPSAEMPQTTQIDVAPEDEEVALAGTR